MNEIRVRFPKNEHGRIRPSVVFDPKAAVCGQPITWSIESRNTNITQVEIEFPNGERFFPDSPAPNRSDVTLGPYQHDPNGEHVAYGTIVGTVPPNTGNYGRNRCKYTVRGNVPNAELDPMILSTDP